MERLHAYFSGHVQGVGFRFTVLTLSKNFAVTGWVRNLSDGRVELVAEGTRETLERFKADIEKNFLGYISRVKADWQAATGEWADFHMERSN